MHVGGAHRPDRHALVATRVDVTGILDRHLRVRRVQAADVLVRKPVLRTDEDFPERPFGAHATASLARTSAACFASRADCFSAYAMAASRTHAPFSHAFTRALSRSRLHGPLPFSTLWNSSQSIGPKS